MGKKKDPSEYYFYPVEFDWYEEFGCYDEEMPEVDVSAFYIAPKDHWDSTHYAYDGCVHCETTVPKGFGNPIEGCYEIQASKEKGRQMLLDAGFIEKYIGPPWGK